jgi:AcrR family transcriptional regulator
VDPDAAEMPVPPGRERRKSVPARRPLDYAQIVDAAMRVLDAEGVDGMSMRRVAQELGTGAASLYAHIQNKEELVDAVLDRAMGEVVLPESAGDPADWRRELKQLAYSTRAALAAHRDVAKALWGRIPTGPNAMALTNWCFGILRGMGLPDQIVAWAGPLLFDYVTHDAFEARLYSEAFGDEAIGEQYFQDLEKYFTSLPATRFPHVVALADALTTGGGDERFEFGLNVLLAGLEAHLPGSAGAGSRSEALGDRGGDP